LVGFDECGPDSHIPIRELVRRPRRPCGGTHLRGVSFVLPPATPLAPMDQGFAPSRPFYGRSSAYPPHFSRNPELRWAHTFPRGGPIWATIVILDCGRACPFWCPPARAVARKKVGVFVFPGVKPPCPLQACWRQSCPGPLPFESSSGTLRGSRTVSSPGLVPSTVVRFSDGSRLVNPHQRPNHGKGFHNGSNTR